MAKQIDPAFDGVKGWADINEVLAENERELREALQGPPDDHSHYFRRKADDLWYCQEPGCKEVRRADGRIS